MSVFWYASDGRKVKVERDEDGKLPAFAWPGGYPILYYAKDGFTFCPSCANEVLADEGYDASDKPAVGEVFYEGPAEECEHCHKQVDSAYGDPDSPEEAEPPFDEEVCCIIGCNEKGTEQNHQWRMCPEHYKKTEEEG